MPAPDAGRPGTRNTAKRRAMSDVSHLPLADSRRCRWLAAVVTAFLGPRVLRSQSHWPCILGAGGACVVAVIVLLVRSTRRPADKPLQVVSYYTWFQAGAGQRRRSVCGPTP